MSQAQPRASGRTIHYGWWIVAATMVLQIFASGCTIYSFGLFIKPIAEDLAVSRGTLTSGVVLWMLGMAAFSPLLGRLVDRRSPRFVMMLGAGLLVAGLTWISFASSPLEMALAATVLLGAGSAGLGPLSCVKVVTNWFTHGRTRAIGVSMIGGSVSGMVLLPVLTLLIERYDWREVLRYEAVSAAVILPLLIMLVVRDAPHESGSESGEGPDEGGETSPAEGHEEWTFGRLVRDRNFWLLVVAKGMILATGTALVPTLIPYATDSGIGLTEASLLLTAWSGALAAGKVVIGHFADRMDRRQLFLIVYATAFGYLAVLLLAPAYGFVVVATVVGGLAVGGALPLVSSLSADLYGAHSFGTVWGTLSPFAVPLSSLAVFATGYVYDLDGSYDLAFQGFMIALGIGALALASMQPRSTAPVASAGTGGIR